MEWNNTKHFVKTKTIISNGVLSRFAAFSFFLYRRCCLLVIFPLSLVFHGQRWQQQQQQHSLRALISKYTQLHHICIRNIFIVQSNPINNLKGTLNSCNIRFKRQQQKHRQYKKNTSNKRQSQFHCDTAWSSKGVLLALSLPLLSFTYHKILGRSRWLFYGFFFAYMLHTVCDSVQLVVSLSIFI